MKNERKWRLLAVLLSGLMIAVVLVVTFLMKRSMIAESLFNESAMPSVVEAGQTVAVSSGRKTG